MNGHIIIWKRTHTRSIQQQYKYAQRQVADYKSVLRCHEPVDGVRVCACRRVRARARAIRFSARLPSAHDILFCRTRFFARNV